MGINWTLHDTLPGYDEKKGINGTLSDTPPCCGGKKEMEKFPNGQIGKLHLGFGEIYWPVVYDI